MPNYTKDNMKEKCYTKDILIKELEYMMMTYFPNATSFLETSAGDGRLIDYFKDRINNYIAFDIQNDANRDDIKECDYLKEKIQYVPNRICIQNPPFQKGLKFVYKALEECDYCVTILSANSILSIDYSKYWVDEFRLWKKMEFDNITNRVSIVVIGIRKRREWDKYEWE